MSFIVLTRYTKSEKVNLNDVRKTKKNYEKFRHGGYCLNVFFVNDLSFLFVHLLSSKNRTTRQILGISNLTILRDRSENYLNVNRFFSSYEFYLFYTIPNNSWSLYLC